jgi:hypothetical protein
MARVFIPAQWRDLTGGVALFQRAHPETVELDDIKHKAACLLKARLEKSPRWQAFTAWVARVLRARRLVLLKSVDGIVDSGSPDGGIRARVMRDQLGEIVDEHFARALPADIPCWIVSGARPARVATLLATGSTYGTEVIARARPRDRGDGGRAPRRARR